MNENKNLLEVRNVYKSFSLPDKQRVMAINGVDLSLKYGECLSIVGETGCGKSTLARMIARIEPITKGVILFEGESIESMRNESLRQLRRKMQIISQDPSTAFSPRMLIGDFLMEPFINFNILKKKEAKEKARTLLESVELPEDFVYRYPHQLSGGEQQRVVIARAMALDPLLLICDEPTSALDASTQNSIILILDQMRRTGKVSMLFISHDLALVSNFSKRVAVMYHGYILESLPSIHLHLEARHPYTRSLLQAVFFINKARDDIYIEPEGAPPGMVDLPQGCPFYPRCHMAERRCTKELPTLREIKPGHSAACFMV